MARTLAAAWGIVAATAQGQPLASARAATTRLAPAPLPIARPPALPDSLARHTHRLRYIGLGTALGYGTIYTGLTTAWYTGPRVPLHWFNDLPEWEQLDKCGHIWGSFVESEGAVDMLRWAGLSEKKAVWYGSFVGFAIQSPIELLDGQDPAYGASATDLTANFLGSAAVLAQNLAWHEVRIRPKWSFHLTPYAARRPNVLGSTVPERFLKDYNGQTYWLAPDLGTFLKPGSRWPRWLSPTLGYGAEDLVYNDDGTNAAADLRPYRQFYLSLDVNLRQIPTPQRSAEAYFLHAQHFPPARPGPGMEPTQWVWGALALFLTAVANKWHG